MQSANRPFPNSPSQPSSLPRSRRAPRLPSANATRAVGRRWCASPPTSLMWLLVLLLGALIGPRAHAQTVTVSTLAGGPFNDGPGATAKFNKPYGVAVAADGTTYVADSANHRIRKISSAGEVTTLAGSGTSGYAEGTGTAARFNSPFGVAVDAAGNVYVADTSNHRIRKISSAGEVTTLAGSGLNAHADGTGTAASFSAPFDLAVDAAGNVYVADTGNQRIRKISSAGVVTTLAGSSTYGYADGTGTAAKFFNPSGVAVDAAGNVYVGDTFNYRIRKISSAGEVTTLAGSGTYGYADGTGTAAQFGYTKGVAADAAGNVYVADPSNQRIRKISSAGVVSTMAGSTAGYAEGTGTSAQFYSPSGVVVDAAGNVYVGDMDNHRIRKITSAGVVTTLAGVGSYGYAEGTGTAAQFNSLANVAVDTAGNVFVADSGNHRIRKITSSGVVTTLAGSGSATYADGTGSAASFNYPYGVAVDAAGNVYVGDTNNHRIRKITSAGVVTTLAGSGASGSADGTGTAAQFKNPYSVAVDAAGNVYVADLENNRIRKITSAGVVTTLAGSGASGSADGTGTAARFSYPSGVAVDAAGNVYVADFFNSRIRKITNAGVVTTLAGSASTGYADGTGTDAKFVYPRGVAVDAAGNVYVTDPSNYAIRLITPVSAPSFTSTALATMLSTDSSYSATLTASGTPPANFSVQSGALPAGLTLSASTGLLSGIPTALGTFTGVFAATNSQGTVTQSFSFTVTPPPPVAANFTSDTSVPVTAASYLATGKTVALSLNYAPVTGTPLTVIKNTGLAFIGGTFDNLTQGQAVALIYDGLTYDFVANYYGGSGNDLVLLWANTRVMAWGYNAHGSLGNGSTTASSLPVAVTTAGVLAGKTVLSVAAGGEYSLALCSDGTLASWGFNNSGQLGNNSLTESTVPVAVSTLGVLAGKTVIAVSAGTGYNLALCSDGTLAAWGANNNGQLGNNSTTSSSVPVAVSMAGVLAGKTVIAVSAGDSHSVALCSDGTVAAWGWNKVGQLGNNSTTSSSVPVAVSTSGVLAGKTVIAVSAGSSHSLALCSDGTLVAWGDNSNGQLGNNSTAGSSVPVAVSTAGVLSGKTILSASTATNHNLVLCSDGTLVAWGWNVYGQLGTGNTTDSPVPIAVSMVGALAGKTVTDAAAGNLHSLVQCSDGTLVAWGWNAYGQLGNGSVSNNPVPTPVAVLTTSLAVGERFLALPADLAAHNLRLVAAPAAPATQTITFAPLATKTYGDAPFAVSATASSGLAPTYSIVSGPATISGNTVTLTAAGSVVVRASQAGNASYAAATPVDQSFTVAPAAQTLTFSTLANKTYGDAPFAVSADASSGLTPTYSIVSGPATISGSTLTLTGAGNVVVRASQAGNASYAAATAVDQSFTVAKAQLAVAADSKSVLAGDATPTLTASITGFVNGETLAIITGAPTLATSATAASLLGVYPITVELGTLAASNYTFTLYNGALTVTGVSFTDWQAQSFSPVQLADALISGPSGDPDADGVSNLLEYALGGDPLVVDAVGVSPVLSFATIGADRFNMLAYTPNPLAGDVSYAVEVSADRTTWNSGSTYTTVASDTGTGLERVIITRDNTVTTLAAPRYLRLKVSQGANNATIGEIPVPVSAVSRRIHGSSGTFDLTLPLSGPAGVEPRNVLGNLTLVFTFDRTITAATTRLTGGTGTVGTVVFSGTSATVSLTGVTNTHRLAVTLDGLNGSGNSVRLNFGVLMGDVNGNGTVSAADVSSVHAQFALPVGTGNFKTDMNVNGVISPADVDLARSAIGTVLRPHSR